MRHSVKRFFFPRFSCVMLPFFFSWFYPPSWVESPFYLDSAPRIVRLVNAEREKADLPPLRISRTLSLIATGHALEMAASGKVTHLSSRLEMTPRDRIGYTFSFLRYYGENVASAGAVDKLHQNLMASAPHRENILSEKFSAVGVGLVKDRTGTLYLVQDFIGKDPEEIKPSRRSPYFMTRPDKVVAVADLLISGEEPPIAEVRMKVEKFTVEPDRNEQRVKEGILLFDREQYEEAMQCFKEVLETNPHDRDARYNLALTLQKKGAFSEALKMLTALYEKDPHDLEALYSIGRHYYMIGDLKNAEDVFREVITKSPPISDAPLILVYSHYTLGLLSERKGRPEGASGHYRRVIEIAKETGLDHPVVERARKKLEVNE